MSKYWATSPSTVYVKNKRIERYGWFVEFNPHIETNGKRGMYRLNGKTLPNELMGYELYPSVLMNRIRQYIRKMKK